MRSLSELWNISRIFYRDLAYISFVQSRRTTGGALSVEKLAHNAYSSMLLNKLILTILFSAMALFTAIQPSILTYAAFLLLLTFLFALFFLQMVTYFFQVNFDLLKVYPVTQKEERKIVLLTFIRIFDLPMLANIILFPIIVITSNPWYSAIPAIFGVIIAEVFSLILVTYLSKIFYQKLTGSSRGWKSVLRFVYQIIWGAAFFMLYAFMMWLRIIYVKINEFQPLLNRYSLLFQAIFPVNFGFLIVAPTPVSAISALAFAYLAYLGIKWVLRNIEHMDFAPESDESGTLHLKITGPMLGIIKKDLRIVTRNPGLSIILILPGMEAVLFMTMGNSMVSTITTLYSFVAILLYSLFGIELRSPTKTLPVTSGFIYLAKTVVAMIVYGISLLIMNSYVLLTHQPVLIEQLWSLPSAFAGSVILLKVGDKLNITRNAGVGAFGMMMLIVIGDLFFILPYLALWFAPAPQLIAACVLAAELTVAILILLKSK